MRGVRMPPAKANAYVFICTMTSASSCKASMSLAATLAEHHDAVSRSVQRPLRLRRFVCDVAENACAWCSLTSGSPHAVALQNVHCIGRHVSALLHERGLGLGCDVVSYSQSRCVFRRSLKEPLPRSLDSDGTNFMLQITEFYSFQKCRNGDAFSICLLSVSLTLEASPLHRCLHRAARHAG